MWRRQYEVFWKNLNRFYEVIVFSSPPAWVIFTPLNPLTVFRHCEALVSSNIKISTIVSSPMLKK
jgi:hypothetical protein